MLRFFIVRTMVVEVVVCRWIKEAGEGTVVFRDCGHP